MFVFCLGDILKMGWYIFFEGRGNFYFNMFLENIYVNMNFKNKVDFLDIDIDFWLGKKVFFVVFS